MSGSRTKSKATKQARCIKKAPEKPRKRAASIVELHAFPGRLMLVSLRGKMGHPARALAQFDDIKLVGALEDASDMRDIVLQTGAAVLATMTNYPIGKEGSTIRGLIEAVVGLTDIDVEAVRKAAALEAAAEAQAELDEATARAIEENPDHLEEEAAIAKMEAGPLADGEDL